MSKPKEIIHPRNELEARLLDLQKQSDTLGREIFEESLHALRSFESPTPSPTKHQEFSSLIAEANTVLGLDLANDGDDTKIGFEVRYFYDNQLLDDKKGNQWKLQLPIWSLNFFSVVEGKPDALKPFLVSDLAGNIGWRICLRFHATRVDGLQTSSPKTTAIAIPLDGLLPHPVLKKEYSTISIHDDNDQIYRKQQDLKFPY